MYVSRDIVELSWGCQGQFSNSGKGLGFAQIIGVSFLTEVSLRWINIGISLVTYIYIYS